MWVLQIKNSRCRFYKIQNMSFTNPKCCYYKIKTIFAQKTLKNGTFDQKSDGLLEFCINGGLSLFAWIWYVLDPKLQRSKQHPHH